MPPRARTGAGPPDTVADADLRFKECKCFMKLEEHSSALRVLASIPVKQRSVAVFMTIGALYM